MHCSRGAWAGREASRAAQRGWASSTVCTAVRACLRCSRHLALVSAACSWSPFSAAPWHESQ